MYTFALLDITPDAPKPGAGRPVGERERRCVGERERRPVGERERRCIGER